ncbi:hypothetical protein TNCV_106051 [Trichonephila clavipes]|nr:hypothetical protein TNCV_106051 [Trichonephila clavipes]
MSSKEKGSRLLIGNPKDDFVFPYTDGSYDETFSNGGSDVIMITPNDATYQGVICTGVITSYFTCELWAIVDTLDLYETAPILEQLKRACLTVLVVEWLGPDVISVVFGVPPKFCRVDELIQANYLKVQRSRVEHLAKVSSDKWRTQEECPDPPKALDFFLIDIEEWDPTMRVEHVQVKRQIRLSSDRTVDRVESDARCDTLSDAISGISPLKSICRAGMDRE